MTIDFTQQETECHCKQNNKKNITALINENNVKPDFFIPEVAVKLKVIILNFIYFPCFFRLNSSKTRGCFRGQFLTLPRLCHLI